MHELVCVKCGARESFALDLPIDRFVCSLCLAKHKAELARDAETEVLLE